MDEILAKLAVGEKIVDIAEKAVDVLDAADVWVNLLNAVSKSIDIGFQITNTIRKNGPYLAVHKQAFLEYNGHKAKLVWDFGLWNELTIEIYDHEGNTSKYSVAEKLSDDEIEAFFNEIVNNYGIK